MLDMLKNLKLAEIQARENYIDFIRLYVADTIKNNFLYDVNSRCSSYYLPYTQTDLYMSSNAQILQQLLDNMELIRSIIDGMLSEVEVNYNVTVDLLPCNYIQFSVYVCGNTLAFKLHNRYKPD